jgi:diguanylate cyclase (GGDEF)-like protein/PAS domain S-box-containing protein
VSSKSIRLPLQAFLRLPLPGQLVIFAAGFLPCLWIVVIVLLHSAYDETLSDASKETNNIARLFAEEVNSSVNAIDLTLIDLRERWLDDRGRFDDYVRKRQEILEKPVAFQVSIIDAGGHLAYSSVDPSAPRLDLSDREHFLTHLGGIDKLFVSRPVKGRVSGRGAVQFTRPLLDAGNRFVGVIVLSMAPDYFTRFSGKIQLGAHGSIALVRADGAIVAREPAVSSGPGIVLKSMPDLGPMDTETLMYSRASHIDGVFRLYAWRVLPKKTLAVAIGRSRDEILAPYIRQRNLVLGAACGLSILIVLIGYSLLTGLRDRARARTALEESEFRWKYALEGAGDGVWDWNSQTDTVYFSTRWRAMLGYGDDEIRTGKQWEALIHPEDRERVLDAIAKLVAGRIPTYVMEYRMLAKDGSWRWIFSRGMVVGTDAGGRAARVIGTHTDMTDRKLREETLHRMEQMHAAQPLFQSEQRFHQLADAMPQIVWTADPDGAIDYANSWVRNYTGLTDEINAENWVTILHPDDVAPTLSIWEASVRSGDTFVTEYRVFRSADRSYRWHQVRAVPIRDERGAIVKWYGTTTDNHDTRLANDEIRRLAQRLGTTLESITEAFFTVDLEWKFTYVNKETERLLGRERGQLLGRVLWDEYPDLVGGIADIEYRRAMREHCTVEFDIQYPPLNRWFRIRAYPSSEGLAVYCRDISASRRLQKFKNEQMKLLERMALGAPLPELLELATHIVESSGNAMRCAVMLLGADDDAFETVVAPSLPAPVRDILEQFDVDKVLPPDRRARLQMGPVFVADVGEDPSWTGAHEAAALHGDRACWWYAIRSGQDRLLGTLAVFTSAGRVPDQGEMEILGLCVHTVSIAVERLHIERKARASEDQLEYQSNYDTLTGLANRNLLSDRTSQAIARAASQGEQVWLVCIDLDRFALVNESLGHEAGDLVLQETAARLRAASGPNDTAARTGGDEFVLVLADTGNEHAAISTVQRIMAALGEPIKVGEHEHFLSCTSGLAVFPADGDTANALIKNAHIAMQRAKDAGGGEVQFYTASMNARAMERLRLEGDLRHAVQRGELLLHYQPQVDVRTGRIVGVEALLRWVHPEFGMIPPDRFIDLAEQTGMIIPIGAWVLRTACADTRRWHDAGWDSLRVGVNLSGKQFYQPDLIEVVTTVLAETGLAARYLDIELTEGLVMTDIDHALVTMNTLKRLGVQLSLDDFGTGYSSLAYLKRFPIDVLKIDKSFVRDITTDPDAAAIARSIISLAQSLQLQVIAEGVETQEQLSYLTNYRCDQIQGYYFSRPVPASAFEQLLSDERTLPVACRDEQERTVLLVEDDSRVSAALRRLLRRQGYRVLHAASGDEGLSMLALNDVQVVISDQRMHGMTGIEFLSRVKQIHPQTIRMMLSGYTAVDSIIEATNSGSVFRFHTKPWDDDVLCASIADAFRYHWLMRNAESALA